jgi:uncharacterized protein YjbJ (UPF0337 family)
MFSDVLTTGSRGTQGVWTFGKPGPILREVGADSMSGADKAKNKAQRLKGMAKEAGGRVTGDKSTEDEGRGDRVKSNLKDAGEKVKDAVKK